MIHELVERLSRAKALSPHTRVLYDSVVREWCGEKAGEIRGVMLSFEAVPSCARHIDKILGIAEQTLESKLRYEAEQTDGLLGTKKGD